MSQALSPETKAQQSALTEYCRTAEDVKLIGITEGRLGHYRRLVIGVVRDALATTYPLTKNLLTEKEWDKLVEEFFAQHKCLDPQVWKMPFDAIEFVKTSQPKLIEKYPHLSELLLFEWKEVEYYMMPNRTFPRAALGDVWEDAWIFNPESEIMSLTYPLHMKNARFISRTDAGNFYCLIFRQPETFKVKFMNLSPFFAWMLDELMKGGRSPASLEPVLRDQFGFTDMEEVKGNVRAFQEKLVADGMVIH